MKNRASPQNSWPLVLHHVPYTYAKVYKIILVVNVGNARHTQPPPQQEYGIYHKAIPCPYPNETPKSHTCSILSTDM